MANNKNLQTVVTSAARTTAGQSTAFELSTADCVRLYINVTAFTTGPLVIALQDTPDGTNWFDVASTDATTTVAGQYTSQTIAITATGQYSLNVNRIEFADNARVRWAVTAGTVTFSVQLLRVEGGSY